MEPERQETYERIPWEALERSSREPNRLIIAVAGAVALGALAFSFTRGQPVAPAPPPPASGEAATVPVPPSAGPPVTVSPPMLVAEADLYAVDEERLVDLAAAHAEWFALEFFAVDGSPTSQTTLSALLPVGVPPPEAPEGTQVFVDWVRALSVSELAPLVFDVEVMVRSLVSGPEGGFVRQPARLITVEVIIGGDGLPRVSRPPTLAAVPASAPQPLHLLPLPDDVRAWVEAAYGRVVGGEPLPGGGYRVVVMATDTDGVARPLTVIVP